MASSNVPTYPNMFDPSQLINKYSTMNAQSFPMYNYYGTPTDALGNPDTSYKPPAIPVPAQTPGTAINSVPQSPYARMTPIYNLPNNTAYKMSPIDAMGRRLPASGLAGQGQGTQGGADAIPSAGFQYLLGLSNPNRVETPGIRDYGPPTYQPSSGVLDSFLAQMKAQAMTTPPQSQTGIIPGTAPSSNFLNTLAALRAGSPGAK